MSAARPIGPGTLVLVVGPSGAGKDTIIAFAQALVGAREDVIFPQRVVTRPASAAEANGQMPPNEFAAAILQRAFAFWWDAHGHRYGLPASINDDIRAGRTVVCNVSRTIVPELRRLYMRCKVALVDAPRELRAARICARRRGSDGDVSIRLDRPSLDRKILAPDLTITNVGAPGDAGRLLADMLCGLAPQLAAD